MSFFKKVLDSVDGVLSHPTAGTLMDWVGDFLMGKMLLKDNQTGKRSVDPRWLRSEAPALFAKTNLDENLLREIVYSRHFDTAWRVELFDNWGPDYRMNLATTVPNPALGQIGPHQWDDFRLSLVEELLAGDRAHPENRAQLTGDDRKQKIQELCLFLTELAKLDSPYRLQRLVKIHYCKPLESDYKMVQFQQWRHQVYFSVAEFFQDLNDWMNNPGTDGMEQMARHAGLNVAHVRRHQLRDLRNNIHNSTGYKAAKFFGIR